MFSVVNVRSASDDLTARARIRDAAIGRWGRDGFRAGMRAIAADAGVSAALVVHHFGSKDALRSACDEHVLHRIFEEKSAAVAGAPPTDVVAKLATLEEYAPLFAYVVRSLLDGGSLAARFVDGMVEDAEKYLEDGVAAGTIRPSRDPHGRARALIATTVGAIVMAQTDAAAGRGPAPTEDPTAAMRAMYDNVMLGSLELYTHGLFTDSTYLDAYLAYEENPHE
ncbi:TetR family transcriptional regulator [Cellulomonas septica]|uniref:TetR family transcriptional regulator n=1 Tax=Cellulomonas septica TaxID=285080 RepID=UPI001B34A6A2